jgi:hypothetical protein
MSAATETVHTSPFFAQPSGTQPCPSFPMLMHISCLHTFVLCQFQQLTTMQHGNAFHQFLQHEPNWKKIGVRFLQEKRTRPIMSWS